MRHKKPNRTENTADALAQRIVRGIYPVGTLLPAEPELEREYSASRTVVREAVKTLSAKGLVTVRQRHGTRVNQRDQWMWLDGDVIRWLSAGRLDPEDLLAFSEVRRIFEPEAAALAAARATDTQRRTILLSFAAMEASQNRSDEAVAADKAFHLAILEATGNPVLHSLRRAIEALFDALFPYTIDRYAANIHNHRLLAESIHDRNPEAAREHMRAVLGETEDFLLTMAHSDS
ncbi:Pyruvate dehydrogenase complex repressor [Ensifer sp. M14]|uniref:FadR/GntR family transcriptional regulator n=1 Tax=Ensifer sp. M14 TaxID=2203782 RepID=UPI000E1CB996|nr:FadR/GntR family transcriptional regulator [Ensifer sp. M14]RDL47951.1 Pyruvate dehydrogenase complex repressor [Ensifer sp. M14]